MYQPPHFREDRPEVLAAAISAHPLGILISHGDGGLMADPLPFLLEPEPRPGRLLGHLAKANPQCQQIGAGADVLVIFQGPQHYVSPAWYPSKKEHGKVVPTWNYVVVEARGRARIIEDPAFIAAQVAQLTQSHEADRAEPWAVSDAPQPFIDAQLRGILGLAIEIVALTGKWKVSQNRNAADRAGVAAGLASERAGGAGDTVASPTDHALAMARLVSANRPQV